MRIEIVPEINRVLRRDEHGAKFGDLGMFLLKPFAPFFCQASVFIIRAQFALVPGVVTRHPANEWIRKILFFTPITEPASTGPAQVEITEQAIVYIKSHKCLASASHVRAKRQPLSQETFAAPVPGRTPGQASTLCS